MSTLLYTFSSSHAAMEAELTCEQEGLPLRLIPLPSTISAGCGLALLLSFDLQPQVTALLIKSSIPFEAIYRKEGPHWHPVTP